MSEFSKVGAFLGEQFQKVEELVNEKDIIVIPIDFTKNHEEREQLARDEIAKLSDPNDLGEKPVYAKVTSKGLFDENVNLIPFKVSGSDDLYTLTCFVEKVDDAEGYYKCVRNAVITIGVLKLNGAASYNEIYGNSANEHVEFNLAVYANRRITGATLNLCTQRKAARWGDFVNYINKTDRIPGINLWIDTHTDGFVPASVNLTYKRRDDGRLVFTGTITVEYRKVIDGILNLVTESLVFNEFAIDHDSSMFGMTYSATPLYRIQVINVDFSLPLAERSQSVADQLTALKIQNTEDLSNIQFCVKAYIGADFTSSELIELKKSTYRGTGRIRFAGELHNIYPEDYFNTFPDADFISLAIDCNTDTFEFVYTELAGKTKYADKCFKLGIAANTDGSFIVDTARSAGVTKRFFRSKDSFRDLSKFIKNEGYVPQVFLGIIENYEDTSFSNEKLLHPAKIEYYSYNSEVLTDIKALSVEYMEEDTAIPGKFYLVTKKAVFDEGGFPAVESGKIVVSRTPINFSIGENDVLVLNDVVIGDTSLTIPQAEAQKIMDRIKVHKCPVVLLNESYGLLPMQIDTDYTSFVSMIVVVYTLGNSRGESTLSIYSIMINNISDVLGGDLVLQYYPAALYSPKYISEHFPDLKPTRQITPSLLDTTLVPYGYTTLQPGTIEGKTGALSVSLFTLGNEVRRTQLAISMSDERLLIRQFIEGQWTSKWKEIGPSLFQPTCVLRYTLTAGSNTGSINEEDAKAYMKAVINGMDPTNASFFQNSMVKYKIIDAAVIESNGIYNIVFYASFNTAGKSGDNGQTNIGQGSTSDTLNTNIISAILTGTAENITQNIVYYDAVKVNTADYLKLSNIHVVSEYPADLSAYPDGAIFIKQA